MPPAPRRLLGGALAAAACLAAVAAPTASAKAPSADVLLNLRSNAKLHAFVRDVSDPRSPRYRHYLTVEQLARRYGAPTAERRSVVSWLKAQGVEGTVGLSGTFVTARTTAAKASRLFGPSARRAGAAGARAAVPAALRGVVSTVSVAPATPPKARAAQAPALPIADVGGSMTNRTGTAAGCPEGRNAGFSDPFSGFTPNQYLTAYGHSTMHARGLRGEGQRIAAIEIQGFNPTDIATFATCFGTRIPPIVVHSAQTGPLPAGDETTLDLEVLAAAAPGARSIDVYQGGGLPSQLFATVQSAFENPKRRPNVMSISLGECEPTYGPFMGYLHATNELFALAAGSGVSVFASAGDQGSSGCEVDTTEGKSALPLLAVNFPASSPYVTGVGGTNIALHEDNSLAAQITWNDGPSHFAGTGGGISVMFDRPWYQQIKGFEVNAPNGTSRVIPDVAALADIIPGYAIYCTAPGCQGGSFPAGGWINVGGTSAAAPLTAAGIALANQAAAKAGQPPLGQINPLVYRFGQSKTAAPRVFSDVTQGNNDLGELIPASAFGGAPLGCCPAGKGYDPVTGWGSVKVAAFSDAALAAGRRTARR